MSEAQTTALRVYIVINTSLAMSSGKMVSQGAHAATKLVHNLIYSNNPLYKEWCEERQRKIVLQATETQLDKLIETLDPKLLSVVHDAGLTEVAQGSLTAIAYGPCLKTDTFSHLRLLK